MIGAWNRGATVLLLCSLGCGAGPGSDEGEVDGFQLRPVTFAEWREFLDSTPGIVVVDFWATWCAPCLERFPHVVQLHRRYSGRGVRFVSLCLDDPGDELALAAARRFLGRQQADFSHFLLRENTVDAFEKLDLLGIPAVFVYRDGRLVRRLTGDDPNRQFTDQDVEDTVLELLGQVSESRAAARRDELRALE